MKNSTRSALTALALASVLGITACGTGSTPAESAAPEQSASASPSVNANKAPNFYTTFGLQGTTPSEWKNGEGIAARSSFVIGEYVGYTPSSSPTNATSSPASATSEYQLTVIDGEGTVVYQSKEPSDGSKITNSQLNRVFAEGKPYLVFNQTLETQPDASSTRKAEKSILLTIIDDKGKEVSSQSIKDFSSIEIRQDAVTLYPVNEDSPHKLVDVATGTVSDYPAAPKDYEWTFRWDGVDIFELKRPGDFSPSYGKLTNGTWTVETNTKSDMLGTYTKKPTPFGSLMLTERADSMYGDGGDLIDPRTGKIVYGAELKDGADFTFGVASANNKFVVAQNAHKEGVGVYSIAEHKYYPIDKELNFDVLSVTNDGYVYGKSGGKRAGFNILKESEPKILADVSVTPEEVSSSGIAVFRDGPSKQFVVLKPQS